MSNKDINHFQPCQMYVCRTTSATTKNEGNFDNKQQTFFFLEFIIFTIKNKSSVYIINFILSTALLLFIAQMFPKKKVEAFTVFSYFVLFLLLKVKSRRVRRQCATNKNGNPYYFSCLLTKRILHTRTEAKKIHLI